MGIGVVEGTGDGGCGFSEPTDIGVYVPLGCALGIQLPPALDMFVGFDLF